MGDLSYIYFGTCSRQALLGKRLSVFLKLVSRYIYSSVLVWVDRVLFKINVLIISTEVLWLTWGKLVSF